MIIWWYGKVDDYVLMGFVNPCYVFDYYVVRLWLFVKDGDDDGRLWWWWSSCYVLAWIKVSKMMIAYVIWISIIMCYVCLCWGDELGLCLCDAMFMAYVRIWCYGYVDVMC